MSEEGNAFIIVVGGILAIFALFFLITPQKGNIAGYDVTMPGIAWVGAAAFAIIALYLFFRHRA